MFYKVQMAYAAKVDVCCRMKNRVLVGIMCARMGQELEIMVPEQYVVYNL